MSPRRITFSTLGAVFALAVGAVAFSPFHSPVSTVADPVSVSSPVPAIPDVTGVPAPEPTPPAVVAEPDPLPAAPAPAPVAKSYPAPVTAPAPAPAPPPPASNGQEIGGQAGFTQVNDFRAANGVPPLAWFDATYPKAIGWSHHLADTGALSHSSLGDGVPTGWSVLAENVAWNTSLAAAFTALENSPGHRANLLDARYDRISIGVVFQDGKYWVTQEFYG